MKYGARGIQAAAKAKATEMRQSDTSKDIDDNLEVLDGLVTNLRSENQAMQLNDYPCKVISMVKTYRFNRRQEAKLKGLQLELEEKMTGLGLADEDENGNMVCNPDHRPESLPPGEEKASAGERRHAPSPVRHVSCEPLRRPGDGLAGPPHQPHRHRK